MRTYARISTLRLSAFLSISLVGATTALADCTRIATANDLDAIRNDLDGRYCLSRDLDMSAIPNFRPIGDETPFTGSLDGQGHVIKNLRIRSSGDHVGLFAKVDDGGRIENLGIDGAKVVAISVQDQPVGILVARLLKGTVRNCHTSGEVENTHGAVGGLVGSADNGAVIERSHSSAEVLGGRFVRAGGLVGNSRARISTSYATGDVTVRNYGLAGGLIGYHLGSVERSFASGDVSVGGLSEVNPSAGGLIGWSLGRLCDVYATGAVSTAGGTNSHAGALIGLADFTEIDGAYATGSVGDADTRGGLVGEVPARKRVNYQFAYWDTETTGVDENPWDRGKPLTTAELTSRLPRGFQDGVWAIEAGASYPYLVGVTPDELIPAP